LTQLTTKKNKSNSEISFATNNANQNNDNAIYFIKNLDENKI